MIIKLGKLYKVVSHRKKRNMGVYKTKVDAEERLKQIKLFSSKYK